MKEVTAEQLRRGDHIVGHRDLDGPITRHDWTVEKPVGVHDTEIGHPYIQVVVRRDADEAPSKVVNLWSGTDYHSDTTIFIIETPD